MKVFGAGNQLEEKHGVKPPCCYRKLHLAMDAHSGLIVTHTLIDQDACRFDSGLGR